MHAQPGPTGAGLRAADAYDRLAFEYDEQVSGDAWMRRALQAHYLRVFRPGQRLLDVGCGTGIDAVALASRGVRVLGIDASEGMIGQFRARARTAGVDGLVDARVLDATRLAELEGERFDGAISAFAALNTLPDLRAFAGDLARLLPPGARAVLHILNRFGTWEFLGLLSRKDVPAALALPRHRRRSFTIGGLAVAHTLYTPDEAARAFEPHFRRVRCYGFGALRPPHTVRRLPAAAVRALEWLDLRLGGAPGLNAAGRFLVLDLERRATAS